MTALFGQPAKLPADDYFGQIHSEGTVVLPLYKKSPQDY